MAFIFVHNMRRKNFDLDRYYNLIRYPLARVFSQYNKKLIYIDIAKNQFSQFSQFMKAISFNLRRLRAFATYKDEFSDFDNQ